MSVFENVAEFMKAMGQLTPDSPLPDDVDLWSVDQAKVVALYKDLVSEEIQELENARDSEDAIDAICDSIWVLCGLAFSMGVAPSILQECWNEVYRSNMDKLNGPVAENGKRLKPEGWVGPQIGGIIEYHRKNAE